MIVCYSRKFVFVKTKKTASTSVQAALEPICTADDVVFRHYFDKSEKREGYIGNVRGGHNPLRVPRKYVPEAEWDDYFKFTFVRNPWDQLISAFWFNGGKGLRQIEDYEFQTIRERFNKWLTPLNVNRWSNWHLYTENDQVAVNFVGKYENLETDFQSVCERIGISCPPLGKLVSNHRSNKSHYSRYYGREQRRMVAELCRKEIEAFGYVFENLFAS